MTILVTALPTLSAKLGATTSQLQWISASYSLALAVLLLSAGALGDRFGRRRLLLFGLLPFGVASVAASQMTSANGLIAFAWGSIFVINAPVVVLAVLGVWFLVPDSKDPQAPRLDWIRFSGVTTSEVSLSSGAVYLERSRYR